MPPPMPAVFCVDAKDVLWIMTGCVDELPPAFESVDAVRADAPAVWFACASAAAGAGGSQHLPYSPQSTNLPLPCNDSRPGTNVFRPVSFITVA